MKVFVTYLNEGVKIYFRVSYGICYMLKEEILNCDDGKRMEELIQTHTSHFNIISSHQLLRISYALTLTEMKQSFLDMDLKHKSELKVLNFLFTSAKLDFRDAKRFLDRKSMRFRKLLPMKK